MIPGGGNPLLLGDDGYTISRSLRFRSSASAYLNRTFGVPTSYTTSTWSFWMKGDTTQMNRFGCGGNYSTSGGSFVTQLYFPANSFQICVTNSNTPSSYIANLTTTRVFRDPSAWYHFIVVWDTNNATATDRLRLYVNGSRVTDISNYVAPSLGYTGDTLFKNSASYIGTQLINSTVGFGSSDVNFAEMYFVDGQALTPSSFGETDSITGVWKPKKYTGTYGTNGFFLNFSDNSSNTATTIGKDYSGNGNNWTPNNISVTAGATYDSMTDVPTLGSATQANYCVLNPLRYNSTYATIADGNLKFSNTTASYDLFGIGSIGVSSGKWYFEATTADATAVFSAGMVNGTDPVDSSATMMNSAGTYLYMFNGNKRNNNSSVAYGATFTTNDVIGVAIDLDGGTIAFYKNGVSQGTAFSGISGTFFPAVTTYGTGGTKTVNANFGQRPFAYTPPTGFLALNTFNLPDATIKAGNKHFDAKLWSGTGVTRSITGYGFQPDFVWIKGRSVATLNYLANTVSGVGNVLHSDTTQAEVNKTDQVTAVTSDGFSLGADSADGWTNYNDGRTYVGWAWKANGSAVSNTAGSITSQVSANTSAGFSVVTFTTPASGNFTIGHGLGIAPSMFILKTRSGVDGWYVYNKNFTTPTTNYLQLNSTVAVAISASLWGSTNPTSSVITLGTGGGIAASATGVLYCFSEVAGYSKFGSYTGNGSADGPFVHLGFRPRFVMIKQTSGLSDWWIWDTARETFNQMSSPLYPDTSAAETSSAVFNFDILSNGFKMRSTNATVNGSGLNYIYMAFAENPQKYSLGR